ncbi:hypothetical protein [Bifidobacterium crudilactis]|jgi:hypothetical protein|uniref:hypothetical protein n=1 Tax=Bifidobacterium crudilactis TaxID=327277 RepID=UPI002F355E6A
MSDCQTIVICLRIGGSLMTLGSADIGDMNNVQVNKAVVSDHESQLLIEQAVRRWIAAVRHCSKEQDDE